MQHTTTLTQQTNPIIKTPITNLPATPVKTDMYMAAPKWADLASFERGVQVAQDHLNRWANALTEKQNQRIEDVLAQANDYVNECNKVVGINNTLVLIWVAMLAETESDLFDRHSESLARLTSYFEAMSSELEQANEIYQQAAEVAWKENLELRQTLEKIAKLKTVGEVREMVSKVLK